MTYRKKLIEVALPLEAINIESAREKSIRHGHPSTLHLWWARRPLAACRAVLWASLVDDPSSWPEKFPTEEAQNKERQRLFDILGRIEIEKDKKGNTKQVVRGLVSWDEINKPNSPVLEEAQREIARCLAWQRGDEPPTKPDAIRDYIAKYAPPAYDPFCGGGSIPLEAQRLGLEAHGSDLNPVAVLITKALIEIPPKFRDKPPVNPDSGKQIRTWQGAQGLAEDVRYYGQWMRDEAFKKIGHLYPKVALTPDPLPEVALTPWPPLPEGEGELEDEMESDRKKWEITDSLHKRMIEIARQLRREQTKSEAILWGALRNRQLEGRKFRRQYPIGKFVVDFYCDSEGLVVEVDGAIHQQQEELDRQRQELLESLGLRFVRLKAEQVETNLANALETIRHQLLPPSNLGREARGEGKEATVIAWLWARTVKCPNPACGCQMPLVRSFQLSTKKGKEAWVEPVVERPHPSMGEKEQENKRNHSPRPLGEGPGVRVKFEVKTGKGGVPESPKTGRGATFQCLACGQPSGDKHIKAEGMAGRMDAQLMAIVAEGKSGRVYLSPNAEHEAIAKSAKPTWYPDAQISDDRRSMFTPLYGLTHFHHLFTPRQLVALTTFSDLVTEAREKIKADAVAAGMADDDLPLNDGGIGATAYADAVSTYLAFGVDRLADRNSTICSWDISRNSTRNTFARQAIPMTWDFAEANPMSDSTGNFNGAIDWVVEVIKNSTYYAQGLVKQHDATQPLPIVNNPIFSSDPPYGDNIGYADLSDFFYVWLRRSLNQIYSNICSTLLVPKTPELVSTPYRFGGSKKKAKDFFEEGLKQAFSQMRAATNPNYSVTIFYAFKQQEEETTKDNIAIASTGWETMLEGLLQSNFTIDGTWPMRTELSNRTVASGTNALASSIVLVCRPRPENAPKATRRQFLNELKRELPQALKLLQQGNIAPVDLAQASIGPGMAVFSKYTAVLEADGSPMRVRTALQLINQILDEFLTEQEGEFDGDTRWALTWFEQYQFNEGQYGDAETLSKAKNTSVSGMVEAGILEAKAGKVRLLKREDLKADWKPESDTRMPVWEITQYLIHTLDQDGETGAAELLAKLGNKANLARDLAYRLYSLCDRKGWTQEGIAYNSLVTSWPEINRLANEYRPSPEQLFFSL